MSDQLGERDQMLERLQNLRTILPVFAQELAGARRQAARLRAENDRLRRENACLVQELRTHGHPPAAAAGTPEFRAA